MIVDKIIKNGQIVTSQNIFEAGIAIQGKKIAMVAKEAILPEAKEIIDAQGNYILPGCIECHSHLGLFNPWEKELESETRSAAIGGITTVMSTLLEKDPLPDRFPYYQDLVKKYAYTDIVFYGMVMTEKHLEELEESVKLGITSFKFLMAYKGEEGRALGVEGSDLGFLYRGLEKLKKLKGLPMVHAENIDIIYALNSRYKQRNDLALWSDTRPHLCEEIDIYTACRMAEEISSPLYIVHTSVGRAIDIVAEFRNRGNKVYLETCPHYLILDYTGERLKEPLMAKVNPPLRTKKDQDLLWQGIQRDLVNCVGTDHCSPSYEAKRVDGNIWNMLPGFPGMATMLPLMLSEGVNKHRITLEKVAELCSYNTARIHGLYPRKGAIIPGADADLVIVDLDKKMTVTPEILQSGANFSLYDGWELKGWPVLTMVRGNVVMKEGKIVSDSPQGCHIPTRRV